MGMLDANVSAAPISRVESQRGASGIQPNISVSKDYIEDLIHNKIPQITSSPQDPGRFARRKLDPASENPVAQPQVAPSPPRRVDVPSQQPNLEAAERTAAFQPPIVTSPKYSALDLLLVLAPHLADPEFEAQVVEAHNEQAIIAGEGNYA